MLDKQIEEEEIVAATTTSMLDTKHKEDRSP
jgi:hypothetical protein